MVASGERRVLQRHFQFIWLYMAKPGKNSTRKVYRPGFPYYGSKHSVASLIWERFGNVDTFIEPFSGGCSILLGRPNPQGLEIVNDTNGFIVNFFRAVQHDPETVAKYTDLPPFECDMHAIHAYLIEIGDDLADKLEGNPNYYESKAAGWWCWGACNFIGSGWCSGNGNWHVEDDKLVKTDERDGKNISRKRIHIGTEICALSHREEILNDFVKLQNRLKGVRVCCGDWTRVVQKMSLNTGICAIFMDPPYSNRADRHYRIYAKEDLAVGEEVCKWCIEHGDNPKTRIILCGYAGEYDMPSDWEIIPWQTNSYIYRSDSLGGEKGNSKRERLWISPHCERAWIGLFEELNK